MALNLLKILVFTIVSCVILTMVKSNLTEKQVKATAKLIRNACQPKNKVSDEDINNMQKGIFSDAQNVKCYLLCTMANMKVVKKNGQPDWKAAYSMLDQLPESRIEPTRKSMDKCKEEVELRDDKCDNAWRMGKCIYDSNPENYFMP